MRKSPLQKITIFKTVRAYMEFLKPTRFSLGDFQFNAPDILSSLVSLVYDNVYINANAINSLICLRLPEIRRRSLYFR